MNKGGAGGGAVYGIGLVGALIYFIGQSHTFSQGIIGVIKAILWPGFFVYEVFKFLHV